MERFSDLLGQAIHRIRWCENNKPISVIQDELGYALERSGGTAIAYWRKGHVPNVADLEKLARELIRRSDLDRAWLLRFLESAGYPFAHHLADELFPSQSASSDRSLSTLPTTPTLPTNTYHRLIGRDAQRRELLALLGDPHAPPMLAVDGAGGIGKTALIYVLLLGVEAIGPHLIDQGRYTEAILHWERAEQTARDENALRPLVMVLLRLGVALQKIGRTEEAARRLAEAHTVAQTLADEALQQAVAGALPQ